MQKWKSLPVFVAFKITELGQCVINDYRRQPALRVISCVGEHYSCHASGALRDKIMSC